MNRRRRPASLCRAAGNQACAIVERGGVLVPGRAANVPATAVAEYRDVPVRGRADRVVAGRSGRIFRASACFTTRGTNRTPARSCASRSRIAAGSQDQFVGDRDETA